MDNSRGKHVLVIDDEDIVRNTLRDILETDGYQVTDCHNGYEGIERFHQEHFDLVITDILMPKRDGIDTIVALRQIEPTVKILAISGAQRSETLLEIANIFNADATLKKPFTREEILEVVKKIILAKGHTYL